ncbi:MAG: TetR family transcriptional regulator [Deltaproteobacteria bacterium]|jgi:AcrR family transcriptional regulator|nr:TetR family transcriptional regulator [Deltaproteobacteria bacterium]MBW2482435.1 TetR family transcriptional regulator [Deltaproteobacteria bacterium]
MATKGTRTRQNIIEQSMQLFSVKGYYNTSVSDILAAADLTKGGLYGHFASKEDVWYAVYDQAVVIWKGIVFKGIRNNSDPLRRIEKFIENDMLYYLGGEVFEGGCFFLNMLVELSGQSASMSKHILRGFVRLSGLIRSWLEEADRKGMLRENLDFKEVSNFIIISLNGAAALYISSRDRSILDQTVQQLRFYIGQLRRN